eukprot:5019284-Karenia_brevis.AAC.1
MNGRPSARLRQNLNLSLPVSCGMEKRLMLWPLIAQKCVPSGLQELLSPREWRVSSGVPNSIFEVGTTDLGRELAPDAK